MSLYESLVKLGARKKALRPHIRPVLSHLKAVSPAAYRKTAAGESIFETISEFCNELAKVSQKIMRKEPSVVAHRPGSSPNCSMTHKGDKSRYTISYGVDAKNVDDVKVVIQYMNGEQIMEEETMPGAMEPTDVAEEACDKMLVLMGGSKTANRRRRAADYLDGQESVNAVDDMLAKYFKRGGWWKPELQQSRDGRGMWRFYPQADMLAQATRGDMRNEELPTLRVTGLSIGDDVVTVQLHVAGRTVASEQARRPPSFTDRSLNSVMSRLLESVQKDLQKWTENYVNAWHSKLSSRRKAAGVKEDIRKITQMANRHNMMVDLDTSRGTITVTPEEPFTRRDREKFINWMHSRYELEPVEYWGNGAEEFAYFD